ncbi:MAG: hypothetical protein GXO37_02310 [Chloroflexi bacterium]|nr:hypothetical protein [Chloroflexota bacterium]
MATRSEAPSTSAARRWDPVLLVLGGLWLAWMTLPYGLAWWWGRRQGLVFAGFLYNPFDNFTYLAKMRQGYQGAWVYRLAFTAQPGPGAPIFLYYLALGHLARLLHASLLTVYHAARLLNGGLLFAALLHAVRTWFPQRPWAQRFGLGLALFGSGMGWTFFAWLPQHPPPDMGIPEAFPYLAALTSPHFPLALALLVALIAWPWSRAVTTRTRLAWVLMAGLLSVIYPFGVVVALAALALGGLPLWWWNRLSRRLGPKPTPRVWPRPWERAAWVALGGLPYPLYALWAIRQDPTLVVWNAQNVTPSNPWWQMLLAVSPALPVALYWAWEQWGRGLLPAGWQAPTWAWAVNSVVLSQIPLSLQRRFFVGAYPPAALTATSTLARLPKARRRKWALGVLALSLPSTLLFAVGFLMLIFQGSPVLYLTPAEEAAFAWIREHTPPEALFLSSPDTGARLVAFTGRRVFVGHPLETAHATDETDFVRALLCQQGDPEAKARDLAARGAAYVFVGPREREFCQGEVYLPADAREVFRQDDLVIYALPGPNE